MTRRHLYEKVLMLVTLVILFCVFGVPTLASEKMDDSQEIPAIMIHVKDPVTGKQVNEGTLELQWVTTENEIAKEKEVVATGKIKDGLVRFQNLKNGTYRIEQTNLSDTTYRIQTFIVAIPSYLNGEETYQIDAYPKVSIHKENPPKKPGVLTGKLPQTGQLWWPVSILAAVGLLSLIYGWKKKR